MGSDLPSHVAKTSASPNRDVDDRVLREAVDGRGLTIRVSPVRCAQKGPPVLEIPQIHRTSGPHEDERARIEHLRQRAWILRGIGHLFRDGDVSGHLNEPREPRIRDRIAVDPESVDRHEMGRALLRIMTVRAHAKRLRGNPHHVGERRPSLISRRVRCIQSVTAFHRSTRFHRGCSNVTIKRSCPPAVPAGCSRL